MAIAAVFASPGITGQAAIDPGQDMQPDVESGFAQLINQLSAPDAVATADAMFTGLDTDALNESQTVSGDDAELSAEMMALLGLFDGNAIACNVAPPVAAADTEVTDVAADIDGLSAATTALNQSLPAAKLEMESIDSAVDMDADASTQNLESTRFISAQQDRTEDRNDQATVANKDMKSLLSADGFWKTLDRQGQPAAVNDSYAAGLKRDQQLVETDLSAASVDKAATPELPSVAVMGASALNNNTNTVDHPDAQPVEHKLHTAMGSEHWVKELGNKLSLMVTDKTQSANLHLNPAELGPVQVQIDTNKDQVSVWFSADHPDTRSALEQSLPKLRELFSSQGMSLLDAGVSGEAARQQSGQRRSASWSPKSELAEPAITTNVARRQVELSLLDLYA